MLIKPTVGDKIAAAARANAYEADKIKRKDAMIVAKDVVALANALGLSDDKLRELCLEDARRLERALMKKRLSISGVRLGVTVGIIGAILATSGFLWMSLERSPADVLGFLCVLAAIIAITLKVFVEPERDLRELIDSRLQGEKGTALLYYEEVLKFIGGD